MRNIISVVASAVFLIAMLCFLQSIEFSIEPIASAQIVEHEVQVEDSITTYYWSYCYNYYGSDCSACVAPFQYPPDPVNQPLVLAWSGGLAGCLGPNSISRGDDCGQSFVGASCLWHSSLCGPVMIPQIQQTPTGTIGLCVDNGSACAGC